MKFFLFVTAVMALMPSFELINAIFNKLPLYEGEIFFYISYILISITLSILIVFFFKKFKKKEQVTQNYFYFTDLQLLAVTIVGAFLLMYFVNESVSSYSIINLAVFSEEYRNSIYKGSGLYTVLINRILPLMLSVNIAFGNRFRSSFFFCLFIFFLAVFALGLRVFLIPVVFAFVYKISDGKIKTAKILLISLLLLIAMGSFKFYLDLENIGDKSILNYLFNPFIRLNFITITYYKFEHGFSDFQCILPAFEFLEKCNSELIKYNFFSINPNITNGFLTLSKYSGIALPLPVHFYNVFGFFAIPFLALFLITVNFLYLNSKSANLNISIRIFNFVILTHFITALLEDSLAIGSLDVDICILLIFFLFSVVLKNLKRVLGSIGLIKSTLMQ